VFVGQELGQEWKWVMRWIIVITIIITSVFLNGWLLKKDFRFSWLLGYATAMLVAGLLTHMR